MNEPRQPPTRVLDVVVLSLFCTGLGHVSLGRVRRGIVLFLLALGFVPIFAAVSWLRPSTTLLGLLVTSLGMTVFVYLFAVVDAARIARRRVEGAPASRWNRPAVYALGVAIGLAAPVAGMLLLRQTTFQAFVCPTRSMAPNVVPGDRVLVNRLTFSLRSPVRGEVVVFRSPLDSSRNFVKRVVGLPGDHVRVVDGRVILNGESLEIRPEGEEPPPMLESVGSRRYRIEVPEGVALADFETVVPDGRYFVLGDARANSKDSRHFGAVAEEEILGPVEYVVLPASRFGEFGTQDRR